jgi:hypothetical protein
MHSVGDLSPCLDLFFDQIPGAFVYALACGDMRVASEMRSAFHRGALDTILVDTGDDGAWVVASLRNRVRGAIATRWAS